MTSISALTKIIILFSILALIQTNAFNEYKKNIVQTRKISIPHSQSTSTIEYTSNNIPFITAANEKDLFYTQGYIVAENRLWQMEFWKRLMTGTLSEVFGNATLSADISLRRLNLFEICTRNVANTPPYYLENLENYILGVNSFLADAAANSSLVPPEFSKYGCPLPTQYSVVDSYLFVKALSLGLAGNAGSEVANQEIVSKVGYARFIQLNNRDPTLAHIYPPYAQSPYYFPPSSPSGASPPLPSSSSSSSSSLFNDKNNIENQSNNEEKSGRLMREIDEEMIEVLDEIFKDTFNPAFTASRAHLEKFLFAKDQPDLVDFFQIFPLKEMTYASNNWVVSGNYTNTSFPILSNDVCFLFPNY